MEANSQREGLPGLVADGDNGNGQPALFDIPPDWKEVWKGMPHFYQRDLESFHAVKVHFATDEDRAKFAELVGQPIYETTRSIWYPKAEIGRMADKRFKSDEVVNPRYPVYVPTKGRWETPLTINALEKLGVPYYAVVQPQEATRYESVVKTGTILLLPAGLDGLVPARNWIKDHATRAGAKRHWQIDDNIDGFFRLFNNIKTPVTTGAIFRAMEDFSDRYTNVAISGPNYFMFAPRKSGKIKPLTMNTRVYSCSLISCEIPHRYRDVYNDDTDICLRVLKDGLCTVLFNAFLCMKATTMTVKGGNTPIYQGDGRRMMAESLQRQHPDVVTIVQKWGRWQHQVNYLPFRRNALVLREDVEIVEGKDDFGMELEVDSSAPVSPVTDTVPVPVQRVVAPPIRGDFSNPVGQGAFVF
jgi:hypothetical protein